MEKWTLLPNTLQLELGLACNMVKLHIRILQKILKILEIKWKTCFHLKSYSLSHQLWKFLKILKIFNNYEKWGKIKHIPHLPHWGKLWGKFDFRKWWQTDIQVFMETISEQVKLVYLWFHRFWENLWIYHNNYEKWGKITHIPHLPHWGKLWGKFWGKFNFWKWWQTDIQTYDELTKS